MLRKELGSADKKGDSNPKSFKDTSYAKSRHKEFLEKSYSKGTDMLAGKSLDSYLEEKSPELKKLGDQYKEAEKAAKAQEKLTKTPEYKQLDKEYEEAFEEYWKNRENPDYDDSKYKELRKKRNEYFSEFSKAENLSYQIHSYYKDNILPALIASEKVVVTTKANGGPKFRPTEDQYSINTMSGLNIKWSSFSDAKK